MITIVVATYNRAVVLARSLRTVIAQTRQDWTALVIGDACTDATSQAISDLGDDRIRFVNLSNRFGEQAGPNSVGMALAKTPYVAFLNHDDYWFPDHLERAVDVLEREGRDLFWSRAAFFTNRGTWADRPFFDEVSSADRHLSQVHDSQNVICEPISCWVARRDALGRLGPMKLGSQTTVAPLHDYAARAAKLGLTLGTSEAVTVLKDRMWYAPPSYANTAEFAEDWVQMIEAGQTTEIEETIRNDIWLANCLGLPRDPVRPKVGNRRASTLTLARETGLDLLELDATARQLDHALLGATLTHRTGDKIGAQPDLDAAIAFARRALS